ncbi:MAG: hypothetical protein AAB871_02695 [Patescibacteria group bacterium]
MPSRYQNESLITLAEARRLFGYTSDHLAYLCREGFMWGQRHGRLWLTSEKAVRDYKDLLKKFGKPTRLANQNNSRSGFFRNFDFVLNLVFKPAKSFSAYLKYLARFYKSIFMRKRVFHKHVSPRIATAGFTVGESPFNLPKAILPKQLQLIPWYAEKAVIVPLFLLVLGLSSAYYSEPLVKAFQTPAESSSIRLEIKNHQSQINYSTIAFVTSQFPRVG